jgi:hypothetical protein
VPLWVEVRVDEEQEGKGGKERLREREAAKS